MIANFKDDSTGRYYHVTGYSFKSTPNGLKYYDGDGQELLGEDKTPLRSLPITCGRKADETIITTVTIGYGKSTRQRDIKGIREIATRHARSSDGMHERLKNEKKELKNK